MIKIATVYTATTPELTAMVADELKKAVGPAECLHYEDPSILAEARENGFITAAAAARLVGMFAKAIGDGADVILNTCSSVGEVADSLQGFARYCGVPIVRIDEEMCREAVRTGKRIGVMATVFTTMQPTMNTVLRVAREAKRTVRLTEALLDGAFGLSQEEFRARMVTKAKEIAGGVDCILFAQGSMAYCERVVAEETGLPVFSSPRFGAPAVRDALRMKGLL